LLRGGLQDERASVLTDAYEYIAQLQRQVQELHSELDTETCSDDDASSYEDDFESPSCSDEERAVDSNSAFEWSCASRRGRSRSRVGFLRPSFCFRFDYRARCPSSQHHGFAESDEIFGMTRWRW